MSGDDGKLTGGDPRVSSPEDMQDVIRAVLLDEPRVGIPEGAPSPAELIKEPKGKVEYDLRAASFRYSIRGVVGKMGMLQFRGMVYETLREKAFMMTEIFGGTWKPVAGKMEWGSRTRTQSRPTGVPESAIGNATLDPATGTVGDGPQRTMHVPVEEQDLVLHVAFAELTQKPIICPLYEQRQNRSGARFGYAESGGLVKRMGTRDRQQRELAKRLIEFSNSDGDMVAAELPKNTRARARKFLIDFNMSVGEVSKALGLSEDMVRQLQLEFKSAGTGESDGGS